MINVYDRLTTDFNNNGLATLTNIDKAEVEETINGDYKLTIIYPLADKKSQYLVKDNVIKVPTPRGTDLFRIFKSRRALQDSNSIECLCRHISYDNERNFLEDVRPTNLNGYNALNWLKNNAAFPCNFSFFSDIDTLNTAYYVRKNLLEAIMSDDDNSFLKVWGGELDRRNFNFGVVKQLGNDRGFKISENKNTTDIEESVEGTEVTRVMPTGRDENDQPLLLPEKYVDSPLINNYISPSIKTIDFPNVKVSRDDAQTDYADKEAVYAELRKQVNLMYSEQHIDRPSINYTVDFADLSRTDLYKKLSILQQLYLGDICTIYSNKLKLDLKARLRSYTYDCVLKKYTKLELGDYTKSEYTVSNILNNKIVTVATDNYVIGNKLKQALGGHVIKREGEILICDTDNIATATKVWRFNLNGLGYSSSGYNGDYGIAITMDGEIVANFIKTGELDASLIKVGVISSKNNLTWINVENGTFNFAGKLIWDGNTFTINSDSVKFAMGQLGGNNLLHDSGFELGEAAITAKSNAVSEANIHQGKLFNLNLLADSERCLFLNTFGRTGDAYVETNMEVFLDVNKTYTISYYYAAGGAITNHSSYLYTTQGAINFGEVYIADQQWHRFSIKYTHKAQGSIKLRFGIVTTGDAWLAIDNVQVEDGENISAWKSNSDEINAANTIINQQGLKVKNGAISIENKTGKEVFKGDSDGNLNILGDFTIGGEDGDVAQHTKSESVWKHSNGSYSKVDSNGFFNYIGDTGRAYHHLIYSNFFKYNLNSQLGEQRGTVVLPDEFKGKDFSVFMSISDIEFAQYPVFLAKFNMRIENKNITNGSFDLVSDISFYNPHLYQVADGVMAYTSSVDSGTYYYKIDFTVNA